MIICHKKKEQADTLYFGIHWLMNSTFYEFILDGLLKELDKEGMTLNDRKQHRKQ
jgi:hypothetical protein